MMKYILIASAVLNACLIITVIILSFIISNLNKEAAQIPDLVKIKEQYIERQAIYDRQQKAYDELNQAKTVKDFIAILKKYDLGIKK